MSMTLSSSASAALVGNTKDLVCEILSRLPLNSVMRFRLVCKEWCSLSSTQSFIDMHDNNYMNQSLPCLVVQYLNNYTSSTDDYFLDCATSKLSDHFNTLFLNPLDDEMKSVRESINLTSNFSIPVGGGEGKIYYQQQRCSTNLFHRKTYYHIKLISSYRGFLLFTAKPAAATNMSMSARFHRWLTKDEEEEEEEEDPGLILYNPVTKEKHTVTAPPTTHVYCGFYYHSPTKEHRILYQLMFDPHHHEYQGEVVQFLVFGLQTKSTRVLKLKVNNYITPDYNSMDTAYYNHIDTWTPPVISNGSLHWLVSEDNPRRVENPSCSRSILSFGIESEEFHTMPHPPLSHTCDMRIRNVHNIEIRDRHMMNLLEMVGGILCLCDGYCSVDGVMKPILEIYVVEDYKKWTWIKRYRIDLKYYINESPECLYGLHFKALQILQGDELLLEYHPERWFMWWMYPLQGKTNHVYHEYALYRLNEDVNASSSTSTGAGRMVRNKKKKKRQPFQLMIEGYPGDEVNERLLRMIIKPDKKNKYWKPPSVENNMVVRTPGNMVVRTPGYRFPNLASSVGGNMVALTPSLASFHHNGSAPSIRTFFSIRTNRSYEYI